MILAGGALDSLEMVLLNGTPPPRMILAGYTYPRWKSTPPSDSSNFW